jgi:transposase-like protein
MSETRPALDLLTLLDAYDTDIECRNYLQELRWPDGVACPRCSHKTISRIKARKVFDCDGCRYQFSVTAGTLFHDSHLPLPKWFLAIYLMCESRKGMNANQLKRMLKVSYKTAWYLCHRIRAAMAEVNAAQLSGTVEVDETYPGGLRQGVGSGNRIHKSMVLAAIERGGNVRIRTAGKTRASRELLHGFTKENVADGATNIYTDEARGYLGIGDEDTKHSTVNHSIKEYVRGEVHTNTVESVFSLFKRSLVGSFHQVSEKHLDRYLDEFEFRYNNRKNKFMFRDTLLRLMDSKAMPYEKLTA